MDDGIWLVTITVLCVSVYCVLLLFDLLTTRFVIKPLDLTNIFINL